MYYYRVGMIFGFRRKNQTQCNWHPVEVYAPAIDRFSLKVKKFNPMRKTELNTYQGNLWGFAYRKLHRIFIRQYGAGMLASPFL